MRFVAWAAITAGLVGCDDCTESTPAIQGICEPRIQVGTRADLSIVYESDSGPMPLMATSALIGDTGIATLEQGPTADRISITGIAEKPPSSCACAVTTNQCGSRYWSSPTRPPMSATAAIRRASISTVAARRHSDVCSQDDRRGLGVEAVRELCDDEAPSVLAILDREAWLVVGEVVEFAQ